MENIERRNETPLTKNFIEKKTQLKLTPQTILFILVFRIAKIYKKVFHVGQNKIQKTKTKMSAHFPRNSQQKSALFNGGNKLLIVFSFIRWLCL